MVSHRAAKVIAVLGVIVILIGLFALFYALTPAAAQETLAIPAGGQYYNYYTWNVLSGGSVSGNWTCLNGTPVQVLVYNAGDYNAYTNGANLSGLYNTTAVSGTLDVPVSGFGTYYVVVQHGSGYESGEQDVFVSFTSTGTDPTSFFAGIAALVIGALMIVYGMRAVRKPAPASPAGYAPVRQTYGYGAGAPPMPPSGPDTTAGGGGMYPVPPPLPGTPATPSPPGGAVSPAASAAAPMGTVVVSVQNQSAANESVQVLLNGAPAATLSVAAGTTQQVSLPARLSSPFGHTVAVEVVTSGGRRARQDVFVGAGGTASVALRIG